GSSSWARCIPSPPGSRILRRRQTPLRVLLCDRTHQPHSLGSAMSRLARLSLVTTALTLLAITAGGLVRATGSGKGCPGWPRCYGRWIPPADSHAIIEMSHRYLVSFSIWGAVAVCAAALIWHRRDRLVLWAGLAIVPLFVAQAALGAHVVPRRLVAW